MTTSNRLFAGFVLATDHSGRNKVRFCESMSVRIPKLLKAGYVVHEEVTFPQPTTKLDGMTWATAQNYQHPEAKNLVYSKYLYLKNRVEKSVTKVTVSKAELVESESVDA